MRYRSFKPAVLIIVAFVLSISAAGIRFSSVKGAGECHVKADASGANDGSSWDDAYTDLQSALGTSPCTEIWVAAGTYAPASGTDRAATFQMKSGVSIYGGFAGSEVSRDQRDWDANPTILSGDIDANDTVSPARNASQVVGDNSYHVVTASGTDSTALLDGFIITAGKADGSSPDDVGGGLVSSGGDPTLANLRFSGNYASTSGGGMFLDGGSTITLSGAAFWGNSAGGAASTDGGGGAYSNASNLTLDNVIFDGNTATSGYGGGLYTYGAGNLDANNATFTGNTATLGGGMYVDATTVTIRNSILWNNGPDQASATGTVDIAYSLVQGGCPGPLFNCSDLLSAAPEFADADGADTVAGTPDDDLRLLPASPAVDAGDNATCLPVDFDGVSRPQGSNCDMGAYELPKYSISGKAGSIPGASLDFTDGIPRSVTADGAGDYTLWVSAGWSGTVTPSKVGYVFTPANRSYPGMTADIGGENYAVQGVPVIAEGDSVIVTMDEDGSPNPFSLTLHASDVDGYGLYWYVSTPAVHGAAYADGTGATQVVHYSPDANYHGTDTFVVTAEDGDGGLDSITVDVTIGSINDAPLITEGTAVEVIMDEDSSPTAFGLTLHATDADPDTLTWSILTQASHGTASAGGSGGAKSIGYLPTATYNGTDSFVVQVSDGMATDTITVNVVVRSVNYAPVISEGASVAVTMSEDGSPTAFNLTLHASDADDTWLSWQIATQAAHGTATVSGTGTSKAVFYSPVANYNGADSFIVRVVDGQGGTDSITVNVTVQSVNDAPVITEGTAVSVTSDEDNSPAAFALTLHATDADLNTLTWSILTQASHGTASASGTGGSKSIGYVPTTNYYGLDSFVVRVSDGQGGTDTITVNVTVVSVNDLPVITEGATTSVTMSEDSSPTSFSLTLHAGDTDGILLYWYVSSPAGHGTVTASGVGNSISVAYVPAANYHGADAFVIAVADGQGGTAATTVNVDVQSINDVPLITEGESVSITMDEDGWLTFEGLLLHATDVDLDPLTWSVITPPSHGFASASDAGETMPVSYIPETNYHGEDSFVVRVSDGQGGTDTITVDVTVTSVDDGPTALSLSNTTIVGNLPAGTLIGNFTSTDIDTGETFTYSLVSGDGSADNGYFAIVGNRLQSAMVLDHNARESYAIRVRTTDSGGLYFEQAFTITVSNNNYAAPLLSPDNGAVLLNNRPVFDWMDVPGASSYTLQISRDSAFTLLWLNVTMQTSTYTPLVDLRANSVLYWRVRTNRVGVVNAWSETRTLTTANPPSVPVLSLPAANALVTDYTPTLDWADSTVPAGTTFDRYQVQVATDAGFASLVADDDVSGVTSSMYVPSSDLASSTTYYWRVRSFNTFGHYGAWSPVRTFRTVIQPPVLDMPADLATLPTNRPVFDWQDADGATGYQLQISRNSAFTLSLSKVTVTASTYTPAFDLRANAMLFWRVRATGTNGPSGWSEVRTLVTANPPSIPVLSLPKANALVTGYLPVLDWANSAMPLGSTFDYYQIQVATRTSFDELVINESVVGLTNSIYTFSEILPDNATYYWRVRAYDTLGQYSSWSLVRTFRTPMLPAVLLAPADGEALLNNRPVFDWEDVDGASGYTLQVSRNSTFTLLASTASARGSTYTPTADLPANTTLFWRVRATGTNGPGGWSQVRTLVTATPPSIPVLYAPASKALMTTYTPRLDWANSSVPAGTTLRDYQIQVATDAVFTAMVVNTTSPISEYIPADHLPSGVALYWRVRSFNTLGQYSSWSLVRIFRTWLLPPTLLLPADGSSIALRRPLFDWENVPGASGYTIQVSLSPTFSTLLVNTGVTASTYTPVKDLPLGTLYWRVRANGTNGPGAWTQWTVVITP
jgi:hypothetical protein